MIYNTHQLRQLRLTIGHNMQRERVRQKMPLAKLSRLTSIPEGKIDQYELGKNEVLLDHLLRVACGLGVKIESFMTGQSPDDAKQLVTLHLSPEVIAFFKARGADWKTRIDRFLMAIVEASR